MGESFVGEIETQQHAAARAPPDPRAAQAPARPSPYDLYIEFQEVAALWTCASDHPDELTYRCAFQSVEMGLALLADAAHDERPAARREARMAALAANVAAQVTLARRLVTGAPVPPSRMTPEAAISPGVRALRGLGPTHRSLLAHISDAILEAHFPIPLGIEPDLTRLRAEQGFAAPAAPSGPYLPYESWVQPERVASLVLRDPHSAEDRLFATVHQMTECWLRLVLDRFVRAEAPARQGAWDEAAAHLEQASMILAFLVEHIELLHLMVVADYHPLRVALRGASGAQSAAARVATVSARQFVAPVQQALEARGLTILDVDRFPHDHAGEHRYLEAVGTLERRLMAFYFQHFQLARKVLGTKSLGSLGFEVRALAERFTKPIFPEIDDARFDHVMLTNLAHGGDAGRLIAEREVGLVEAAPAPGDAIDPDAARAAIARYFDAIRAFDLEGWVGTFHPQGTMEDPVGSRPHRGAAELRVFFQGVMRTFAKLDVRPGPLAFEGPRASTPWRARATLYNGREVAFEGTEVFDLDPDGRIVAVRVLWDPRTLAEQLLGEPPAAA